MWSHGCSGRRARPPARLGGLTSFGAAPRSPPVPSGPSGALHTGVGCAVRWFRASASNRAGSPVMSHVIPVPIFQTLKCGCWNCNVCGLSRKVTALNYVRNLAGDGPATAHGHGSQALRTLRRPPHLWRWGFCYIRGWLTACRRRVVVLMSQFPPFGGGEDTT